MEFWRETFPGKIYDLQYETLTQEQEAETRKLLDFIGLDWEGQCLEFWFVRKICGRVAAREVCQVCDKAQVPGSERCGNRTIFSS